MAQYEHSRDQMSAKWITIAIYVLGFRMMLNRHQITSDIRLMLCANFTTKWQVFSMMYASFLKKSQYLTQHMTDWYGHNRDLEHGHKQLCYDWVPPLCVCPFCTSVSIGFCTLFSVCVGSETSSEFGVNSEYVIMQHRKLDCKMAATKLENLLTKLPFWLSLWHRISISWHECKEVKKIAWIAIIVNHRSPQMMPIFDLEKPPKFAPTIYLCHNYVSISISILLRDQSFRPNFGNIVSASHAISFRKSLPRLDCSTSNTMAKWVYSHNFQDGVSPSFTQTFGQKHANEIFSSW